MTDEHHMLDKTTAKFLALFLKLLEAAGEIADLFSDAWEDFKAGDVKSLRDKRRAARAQSSNMVGLFIGLMIAAIVALQVFIPVVNDAINTANLTSTQQTVVDLLPLFAVLLLLIALASPLMRRV